MADKITIGIEADISSFSEQMSALKQEYMSTKKEIDENKIDAPMSQNDVLQSFGYMLSSVRDTETIFQSIQDLTTSLPQGVQMAMSSLVQGMKSSISSLTNYVKVAGTEAGKEFNRTGLNNSIRFSAASLTQYTKDLKSAAEIITQMSDATKQVYSQNHQEIASVVNPAISKMFTKHHMELPDKEIVAELLNNKNYGHISKLLESYGLTDPRAQRQVLETAVKTSSQRINRLDVQRAYNNAGIAQPDRPIFATDVVRDTYKKAYINGGRYINEDVTPTNTRKASKSERHNFYENIKNEILHGNSVAFKAAQDVGLVTLSEGKYRFIKERFATDRILDQFGGYVVRERKRAAQGAPQYHKDLANPYDATALINKDGRRVREADRLIEVDTRPNANPYYREDYSGVGKYDNTIRRKNKDKYENPLTGEYENPELLIPELINIPRMTVKNQNGRQMFAVKRWNNEEGKIKYEPNIDYSWRKTGILENPYDEFITMGRNPILDRLIKRHESEGAKFEDRSFGYGFDEKDNPIGRTPLIISMDLNEFRDKDKWGKIKFTKSVDKNGKSVRETYFPKDATELINGLYRGDIEPQLPITNDEGKQEYVPYRAFAGKTTGGGTMLFMPSADYKGMIDEDKARGVMPMLQYFSEMQDGKLLINPATGKPFANNEEGLGGYARFYDARNKILSHSLPIEELGGRTPTTALVNMEAFYDAFYGKKESENMRFDGGGFIAPDIYTKDFQARMGPAKFLAQRFNWRKWLIDAKFATKGGEYDGDNNYHFFMPGLSATDEDYKTYKEAIKNNVQLNDVSDKFGGKTFKEWRDSLFVDVMNTKYGAMLDSTAIKAPGFKKGRISEQQYDELVKILASSKPNSSFKSENKILDSKTVGQEDKSPMVKLTTEQQTELMSMMSDNRYGLGLRLMKDTDNYVGKKQFWSPAYMSSVMVTPTMMKRSADNYLKAFKELSTDEGIIKRMFSGNDIDSRRVQENNSLIHTDTNLKYRIAAEKKNLVEKQLLGYGYFPEESGMSSQMLVAGVNPYSFFNSLGYDLTGHNAEGNAAKLKTAKHGVIAGSVGKDGIVNWTRSPYAPGANFFGTPIRKKVLNDYSLTNDSALFNIEDFYELNTGDFDGDFVWANTALKEDEEFKERTERRNKKVTEIANKRLAERKALLKSQGKTDEEIEADALQFAGITDRAFNASSSPTGLGYKIGQAFRMGLFTEKDLAEIDDYANDTYQKGIDMAKKVDVRLSAATPAVQDAIRTRKPIERLTKELQATFEGEGAVGSVDLFKYGLPTYVDQIGTNILSSSKAISQMDVSALDFLKEQIEQNNEARYADATIEEQNLGRWYGNLVANKLTGKFQITSTDTLSQGRSYLQQLQAKIAEFEARKMDTETLDRMKEMEREARSVINTESTIGYTESNKEVIAEFNRRMNWDNPVSTQHYNTEAEAAAAAVLYEQRRQEENSRVAAIQQSELDKIVKEQTGKSVTDENRQNIMDRITAAHMYTGFNWSNAKYFTEGSMTIPRARYLQLTGENPEYMMRVPINTVDDPYGTKLERFSTDQDQSFPVTIDFNKERQYNQAQVARQILTGTKLANPKLDAHAIVGSAAHTFMDTYGRARAFRNDEDRTSTPKEALAQAKEALKDYLLGEMKNGKRVLSKEQRQAQTGAGVSFSEDDFGNIVVSGKNAGEVKGKIEKINKGSLEQVASLYYERALQNLGEHMIMTEGTSFGLNEHGDIIQEEALGKEGHNGIFIVPTRNNQNVIGFQRFRKDEKTGKIEAVDAGTYFTPDMVKQDANGAITISDWKSSEYGQKDALFQTAYYAHNLEELGKRYYLTGNKDYEKYARYVNYDKEKDQFTSNIKYLEAIDLFGGKNDAVLQADYTMELGDAIAKWVETGMQNEAKAAQLGFIKQLPQHIQPLFNRAIQQGRPVYAPGEKEKEYTGVTSKDVEQLINEDVTGTYKQLYEIAGGGTGIKDAKGEYIDQDKAFLVEKYKEDRETLKGVRSFAAKERVKLYNLDYKQKDRYTQNIEALQDVFTPEDYATLQKYYQGNHGGDVAADVAMMDSHFTAQQQEARHQMEELYKLRAQYYKEMPDEMAKDYNRIAFGQGTSISKLRAGVKKRQQDLSVIDEVYKTDEFYDETLGYIPTDANDIFKTIYKDPERGENESKKAYNKRRKELRDQKLKEAQDAANGMKERQQQYDNRVALVNDTFAQFENSILQNINEEKQNENFTYDLLKGQDVKKSIFELKEKASEYQDLEKTRLSEGGPHAYSDNARKTFSEESQRLTEQVKQLEELSNSKELNQLLSGQKTYDQESLIALMTGRSVSRETIKNKRMFDFALQYAKINPNKTIQEILGAAQQYGQTYEEQINNKDALLQSRSDHEYNQFMRSETMNKLHRYGFDRTKIGRGLATYYGGITNAEQRQDKINKMLYDKQNELKSVDRNAQPATYSKLASEVQALQSASQQAGEDVAKMSGPFGAANAAVQTLGTSFGRLTSMFGRRIFMRLISEVKQFTTQFQKSLTEIQMITLKSDDQMSTLGDSLIDKAKELKVSILEITQSASTLYRQGLSDEEVEERLDVISKFSRVSGTKVADATKLITVAMNTGLVTDAMYASDVVTALGDNAATNAQQIEKGIEKSGAAAAADGTTFAELAAMLTAITSTTQIGGNVAGRTLNTIFGRMNKIGTSELIVDENGNKISGSAVAKLLAAQGIKMYDENGKKRSTYDTLYALSQKWEDMSDAEQQQMANAIAGTRQYSNFAAIMQGMSEGKVDEYMKLTDEATGITDKKNEVYMKSLQASMTNLKNTWDSLVESLTDSGALTGFIDGIATMIEGVKGLTSAFGELQIALPTVMILLGALSGAKLGGLVGAGIGAAIGLATYGITTFVGNAQKPQKTASDIYQESLSYQTERYEERVSKADRLTELANKKSLTEEEKTEYDKLVNNLGTFADVDSSSIEEAAKKTKDFSNAASDVASSAEQAAKSSEEYAKIIAKEAKEKANRENIKETYGNIGKASASIASGTNEAVNDYYKNDQTVSIEEEIKKYAKLEKIEYTGTPENINEILKRAAATSLKETRLEEAANSFLDKVYPYLAEQSSYNVDLNDADRNRDKNFWKNRILGMVGNPNLITGEYSTLFGAQYGDLPSSFISTVFDFAGSKNQSLNAQKEGLHSGFVSYLKEQGVEERYISAIANQAVDDYYSNQSVLDQVENGRFPKIDQLVVEEIIGEIFGRNTNAEYDPEAFKNAYKAFAIKGNYKPSTTEKLEDEGITNADYVLDERTGETISLNDALTNINTYKTESARKRYHVSVANDRGQIVEDYWGKDYDSIETTRGKAESRLNENNYTFTDTNGNVHYKDESGEGFASEEEANKAAKDWDYVNAKWLGTVSHNTYSVGENGKINKKRETINVKETGKVAAEQKIATLTQDIYSQAYQFYNPITGKIETFSSDKERQEAMSDVKTTLENERKEKVQAAIAAQDAATTASYTNAYGESFYAKGLKEVSELYDAYKLEDQEAWKLVDNTGKILGRYNSRESANNDRQKYDVYTEMYSGDYLGTGKAGKEAAENLTSKYKNVWINGQYIGYGDDVNADLEGKYNINNLGRGVTRKRYIDKNGKEHIGSEFDIRNLILSDRSSEFANNKSYNKLLSYMEDLDVKAETPKIVVSNATQVRKTELGKFDRVMGELADVPEVPDLESWEDIPDTVGAFQDSLSKFGTYVKTIIESDTDVFDDLIAPQYKGIKDYFMSGATNSALLWDTDKKNAYAVNADNMLRMILGSDYENKKYNQHVYGENSEIQKLFNYVNREGIQEWDSLYDNAEFGRIMDQIQRDDAGNIISAPEDILDQIIEFLYSNGRDYGKRILSSSEKATYAQSAFDKLMSGRAVSREAARYNADQQAKEYNKEYDQRYEVALARHKGAIANPADNLVYDSNVIEKLDDAYLASTQKTAEEILTGESFSKYNLSVDKFKQISDKAFRTEYDRIHGGHKTSDEYFYASEYLSDLEESYLKEVLGDELGAKIKDNKASDIEKTYAAQLIQNYQGGFTGLTDFQKAEKLQEMTGWSQEDFAKNWKESQATMSAYASGYSLFNEYAMLKSKNELSDIESARLAELEKGFNEYTAQEVAKANAYNSLEEMSNYQSVQYGQTNKLKFTADEIFKSLPSAAEGLKNFGETLTDSQVENWKDFLAETPEVNKKLKEMGVSFDDNKIDFSNVESSGSSLAEVFNYLITAVSGASESFSNFKDVLSKGQTEDIALRYLSGEGDEETGYEAYAEFIGNEKLAEVVRNNRLRYNDTKEKYEKFQAMTTTEKADYLNKYGSEPKEPIEYDEYEGLNEFERTYADYLTENAKLGISGLTDSQKIAGINEIVSAAKNGTLQDLREGGKIGAFEDYLSGLDNADQLLEDLAKGGEPAEKAIKEINDQLSEKYASNIGKYVKGLNNYSASLANIKKGGADAAKGYATLRKEMNNLQNVATALSKAQDKTTGKFKSGKQIKAEKKGSQTLDILSDWLGVDAKELEEYSAEDMEKAFGKAQQNINSTYSDVVKGLLQTAVDTAMEENPEVKIDMGMIQAVIDGKMDLSEVQSVLGENAAEIVAMIQAMAGKYGSVKIVSVDNGNVIDVIAEVDANNKYHGGGGGGGGGKSAAQKLIERQQMEQKERQHKLNMLGIEYTHAHNIGNYSQMESLTQQQIDEQNALKKLYDKQIQEVKDQLSRTKKDSDDYKSLIEQLHSLEEAAAGVKNAIHDLEVQISEDIKTRHENELKTYSHASSMLSIRAQKYQLQQQNGSRYAFSNWMGSQDAIIQGYNDEIAQKKKYRAAMLKEMDKYQEGDTEWNNLRDSVFQLEEDIATLQNNKLQTTVELNNAKVAQVGTDLMNANASTEHNLSMSSAIAGYYQSRKSYKSYRTELKSQNKQYQNEINDYMTAMEIMQNLMTELPKYSDAWYSARDAVYQYEEAILTATLAIEENNVAIQQSKVEELSEKFEDVTSELQHVINMYDTQMKKAEFLKDDDTYLDLLEDKINKYADLYNEAKSNLWKLESYADSGAVTDEATWDDLRSKIMSAREEVTKYNEELLELRASYDRMRFDYAKQSYERISSRAQHELNINKYASSYYKNRGELSMYGNSLNNERSTMEDQLSNISEYIKTLKKLQKDSKSIEGTAYMDEELYENITQEIMKQEEEYDKLIVELDKLNEEIEKNKEAIRQVTMALENAIDKEIKNRIQKQKNQLAAEINLQNEILNVIKQRYNDEWNIIKADIEKKKQALNQEKNLINERLNARKKAQNQEDKEEELAEYKRQLALISSDASRTKDVKELQRKIEEMEKELAWQTAEDEANAAIDAIDEQIAAYDKYVSDKSEDLADKLKDNNNLINDERFVTAFSGDTADNYIAMMRANSNEYRYATEEARAQLEDKWTQTWKTMKDILDTYWDTDDFKNAMSSQEAFIEYMKGTDEYRVASETGKESLEYKYAEMYKDYVNASLVYNDKTFTDTGHAILDAINDMKDWTYEIDLSRDALDKLGDLAIIDMTGQYATKYYDSLSANGYTGDEIYNEVQDRIDDINEHSKIDQSKDGSSEETIAGGSGSSSSGNSANKKWAGHEYYNDLNYDAHYISATATATSDSYAKTLVKQKLDKQVPEDNRGTWGLKYEKMYKKGGLVDYTGQAWVDGTKTHPEAFLSAYDTESIRAMTDALNYVRVNPGIVPETEQYSQSSSVGDITITINQAELKSDADFDEVARLVGQKFTKELSKKGFNLTGYAF